MTKNSFVAEVIFKYFYQQIFRKISRVVTKAEYEEIIRYEFGK